MASNVPDPYPAMTALLPVREALARGDLAEAVRHAERAYGRRDLHLAEQICRLIVRAQPGAIPAVNLLALITAQTGRATESLHLFEQIALSGVTDPALYLNWGNVLRGMGRVPEALKRYEQALALRADFAEAHNARGAALLMLKDTAAALACFERALTLQPGSAEALGNRAAARIALRQHVEALQDCERALALQPADAHAHFNRAICLRGLNRPEDALASCERTLALTPGHVGANSLKSQLLILLGRYEEGWRLHEWRWRGRQKVALRHFTSPQWTGDVALAGKTLLIHAEMGFGDTIQFCRYAPLAAAAGAQVLLEVQPEVAGLVATLQPAPVVLARGAALPPFDLHCPMMSLPYAFRTRVETIPAAVPYLHMPEPITQPWRETLGARGRPRIGLAWAASAAHDTGVDKTVPVQALAALLAAPFDFHVLHNSVTPADAAYLAAQPNVTIHAGGIRNFLDTAALIAALDCVVSVDTAAAHVAGALAADVLIMLPFAADYRWFKARADSPWYPTATLFRQTDANDWTDVVQAVAADLARRYS